eukprot:8732234-Heterocapsa_arctica.AAC.1
MLVAGDSGCMSYCSNKGRKLESLLKDNAECIKYPWSHASISSHGGGSAKDFYEPIDTFIKKNVDLMTPAGPNGIRMFPASVACVVIDNLNACFLQQGDIPGNAKADKYHGLRAGDGQEWWHINRLMDLVKSNFR